ncbi:MAG TPA: hypothetical protein PKG60_13495 [Spirochaetota bacterium]|nr:hypothetical protein [Spirochaetota bacterium]HPS86890.1 hypothetical protein [Spirochaetota bacterium]
MLKKTDIKVKVNSFVPYLATFYYIEIIYLMIFLNFLYGKIFAVSAGLLLTFLLTFHVIRLFNKKDINRKIQLYCMDVHFAYTLAYFFNRIFSENSIGTVDSVVMVFRLITACIEIAAVLILTDRIIKSEYTD